MNDMAMLTAEEFCKRFNDSYPYPSCMEVRTDKQRETFLKMAELGLVKFSGSVRCGFEAIRGEYVHLTKAGFEAATKANQ